MSERTIEVCVACESGEVRNGRCLGCGTTVGAVARAHHEPADVLGPNSSRLVDEDECSGEGHRHATEEAVAEWTDRVFKAKVVGLSLLLAGGIVIGVLCHAAYHVCVTK